MLALHPEVQQKAVQEIMEVFGTVDAPIDFETLNQLPYLDMVVKETMRLFPVLPVSARVSSEEFDIGRLS
jgi:cytochrome P450